MDQHDIFSDTEPNDAGMLLDKIYQSYTSLKTIPANCQILHSVKRLHGKNFMR